VEILFGFIGSASRWEIQKDCNGKREQGLPTHTADSLPFLFL